MHEPLDHPAPRLLGSQPAGRQPARDRAAARPRRAVRRPRRRSVAVPGLAVRAGRQDPGRRARRRQDRARGRARRGALVRSPPAPAGCWRDAAARPALRGALRLRRGGRSQRRSDVNRGRGPRTLAPCASCLVSQMYPGPDAPDLGTFVAQVERELVARGHEVELAVLDTRAGGKLRYLALARKARAAARRRRLRALPRAVRLHRRSRGRRAARHRAREGRPQHRRDSRRHRRDAARREAGGGGDLRLRLPSARARDEAPGARGKIEVVSSGVDPRALRGHRPAVRAARLPLRRGARRAEERRPSRRRLRAPRRGNAHLRR